MVYFRVDLALDLYGQGRLLEGNTVESLREGLLLVIGLFDACKGDHAIAHLPSLEVTILEEVVERRLHLLDDLRDVPEVAAYAKVFVRELEDIDRKAVVAPEFLVEIAKE